MILANGHQLSGGPSQVVSQVKPSVRVVMVKGGGGGAHWALEPREVIL